MKKSGNSVHRYYQQHHYQQQQSDQQQQQQMAPNSPPNSGVFSSRARTANAGAAAGACKTWPIKLALLLCCICSLLGACSAGEQLTSSGSNGNGGGGGDTLTSNPPALLPGPELENEVDSDVISSVDCLFPEDCLLAPPKVVDSPIFHSSNPAAQTLLPQLVQRYLRELDSTGNAPYAIPRFASGNSGSTTVFKSVPYPIAQLLLARLRSGGLRGAAEVSAEPMVALTPIRKQRGNQLKMANRFGKRDRLRMSNRFGRRWRGEKRGGDFKSERRGEEEGCGRKGGGNLTMTTTTHTDSTSVDMISWFTFTTLLSGTDQRTFLPFPRLLTQLQMFNTSKLILNSNFSLLCPAVQTHWTQSVYQVVVVSNVVEDDLEDDDDDFWALTDVNNNIWFNLPFDIP